MIPKARRSRRRIVVTPIPTGVRIDIPQARNWLYAFHFTFLGGVLGVALLAFRGSDAHDPSEWLAAAIALVIVLFSARQVLWAIASVERITVDQRHVVLSFGVHLGGLERFLTRTRRLPRATAGGLRYSPQYQEKRPWWKPDLTSFALALQAVPLSPQPTLFLHSGETPIAFGEGLDEAEANRVIHELTIRFPALRG